MRRAAESAKRDVELLLGPLLDDPAGVAFLCDLDGTLAPIVERAEDAAIPERARAALQALARRYPLCAIVSGRRAANAREIVGLPELTYVGIHGFELLRPGERNASAAPALRGREEDARSFAERIAAGELDAVGIRVEDKGPIVALHWRGASDADAAEAVIAQLAATARGQGLVTHLGRKVLELRPAVAIDKGVAVEALIAESGARAALYAGDDRTDLDAFRALARLREEGALEAAVRIGVRSAEGPDELGRESDLLVEGPEGLLPLIEAAAG